MYVRLSDSELLRELTKQAGINRVNMTKHELAVWDHLNGRRWPFVAQHPVILYGARGHRWPMIWDFYSAKHRLVIEVDGYQHQTKQKGHDERRDRACRYNDYEVVRLANRRVERDLRELMMDIEAKLLLR